MLSTFSSQFINFSELSFNENDLTSGPIQTCTVQILYALPTCERGGQNRDKAYCNTSNTNGWQFNDFFLSKSFLLRRYGGLNSRHCLKIHHGEEHPKISDVFECCALCHMTSAASFKNLPMVTPFLFRVERGKTLGTKGCGITALFSVPCNMN